MVKAKERKEWAREKVKGLFFGNTTPFTEDLSAIDEEALRSNLRHCVALGADGIGWGGPLAEPNSLTTAERKRGHEILAEEAQRGGVVAYAYPVTGSFPECLELTRHAAEVGCDLVMVNVPFDWAKSDQMIYEFYDAICAAAGGGGVMLYNTAHSGYLLPLDLQDRICNLPNVCSSKGSGHDLKENVEILERLSDRIVCSAGTIPAWPDLAEAGYRFLSPNSTNYLVQTREWQPVRELFDLTMAGDFAAARAIVQKIDPLIKSWFKLYQPLFGRPFGREEHPDAGIKYWQDIIGMRGGPVRPPTAPFAAKDKEWVDSELAEHRRNGILRLPELVTTSV
jgi:4-hydroxy-tetrahydrodipicolinate synthase